MSKVSSFHIPRSTNGSSFSPLPSSRALFQRCSQQASHESKPSVSDPAFALQRFGRGSEASTGASEERVRGAAAEPAEPTYMIPFSFCSSVCYI
ncbi:unnamed protein product [Brassica rapa]|uniref:Uncharacterized protein n=2 Tax=Brassica TaxID=3705 RepID=A0A8D9HBL5_BRACM|nr:unnamed protein product [Brassica napus]CAG7896703.1 unnamed protein product [Brassica rapa]